MLMCTATCIGIYHLDLTHALQASLLYKTNKCFCIKKMIQAIYYAFYNFHALLNYRSIDCSCLNLQIYRSSQKVSSPCVQRNYILKSRQQGLHFGQYLDTIRKIFIKNIGSPFKQAQFSLHLHTIRSQIL
jgi:hypothetical protein